MNNNDNFNLNNQEIKKIALVVYVVVLILIFLFPPMNKVYGSNSFFEGWSFISDLGGTIKVNIPYLLVEMGMATVVYIFFLISQKK